MENKTITQLKEQISQALASMMILIQHYEDGKFSFYYTGDYNYHAMKAIITLIQQARKNTEGARALGKGIDDSINQNLDQANAILIMIAEYYKANKYEFATERLTSHKCLWCVQSLLENARNEAVKGGK